MLRAIAVAALLLSLAACGQGLGRGIVIDSGGIGMNTPERYVRRLQERVREAIRDDLGAAWGVQLRIAERPLWIPDRMAHGATGESGEWRFERITATLELVPPPGQRLADEKRAEIERAIADYLLTQLERRDRARLSLTLEVSTPAPAAASAGVSGERSYVVQPGDTLADLSTAFYGSPQHWRRIAEANPGELTPGRRIVIPPLPAAPAAEPPPPSEPR
ncbi:MAG: LysM peptidoglycan-binding domain-containing protein [Planctomycetota bacterium]|nr:LysM peptidoglycan-binding domain-containing protein [Planctomycetota bacterium]